MQAPAVTVSAMTTTSAPPAPQHTSGPSSQQLSRFSAYAVIAGSACSLVGGLTHPVVDGHAHSVAALTSGLSPYPQLAIYVGALLLMIGLPGVYVSVAGRIGRLGALGFGLYLLTNATSAQSHLVVEAFVAPTIARDPAARHLIPADDSIVDATPFQWLQVVAGLALITSLLLVGIALLRARVRPVWIGWLLLGGALLLFAPLPELPGVSGVVVEVPRGVAMSALAVLSLRRTTA